MKYLQWTGALAAVMTLGLVSPALSHHSHAMFDHTQFVNITGTVTNFDYRNPHAGLYIDTVEKGKKVNYWIEMSNLPNMIQRGIGANTFKQGDKVTVKLHPLKDGRPGGSYVTITSGDGKTYE